MTAARHLLIYLEGIHIGVVEQTPHGSLSFTYDPDYAASEDPTPLSLSMPITDPRHRNRVVRAYLDGLLPDSEAARQRLARDYNVSSENPFGLLAHIGRDAAGAVQVLPPDTDPDDARPRTTNVEWLSDADFAQMVRALAEDGDEWDPGRFGGRWSLAGAQPKMALFHDRASRRWGIPRDSTPTTAIVKPAIEGFAGHHINEALCLRAAAEAGLPAAEVDLVEVDGVQAIVSHRYDRVEDPESGLWRRVHQEDLCQALAVHPSRKYQTDGGPGVGDIAELLARLPIDDRAPSAERFFRALAFNVLIGGTDAHAKNYAMILIGQRAQIGPLYDVASAACYPQHDRLTSAMKIDDQWRMLDVTDKEWDRVGRRLGLPAGQAIETVRDLRGALPGAFERAIGSFPTHVHDAAAAMGERIVEHVQGTWRPDLARDPRHVL